MTEGYDDTLRIPLADAGEALAAVPETFLVLFKRGDFSAELFAPVGTDVQKPHAQDEVYIIASGSGIFRRGEERVPFVAGDFLFVAAGVSHAFETFSADFKTWVIFFGPQGGMTPA